MSDHSIFITQQIQRLGKQGYVESSAYPDFFNPMFAACKAAHPTAQFVDKAGPMAITQIIYLPKAKKELLARLKNELAEYEKTVLCTTAAIKLMEEQA